MSEDDIFLYIILGMMGVVFLIALISLILSTIGKWKMFKKAGKGGWEALIPIYNKVVLCEIAGINSLWILILIVAPLFTSFIPFLGPIYLLANIYFKIILGFSLAKSFDKSEGFGILHLFFPSIFYLILGCSSSKYLDKKPTNDFIGGIFSKSKNDDIILGNDLNNQEINDKKIESSNDLKTTNNSLYFCPGCGSKLECNTKYCGVCGRKI